MRPKTNAEYPSMGDPRNNAITRRERPRPFRILRIKCFAALALRRLLHKHVEKKPVLINGAPKPLFLSTDGDDNLIEMPFAGRSLPDIIASVGEISQPKIAR